jgi:hypothetical protein
VEIEEDEDAVVFRRLTSHISHQLSGLSLTSKSLSYLEIDQSFHFALKF